LERLKLAGVSMFCGETCLLKRSKDSWQVLRIFSSVRGGQTLIFLFIQLQRPSPIDDANPFTDGVENQAGLLRDQSAFQGKEISGIRKDGGKALAAQKFDGLFNRGNFHNLAQ